jgi:predicted sulfurtransferase
MQLQLSSGATDQTRCGVKTQASVVLLLLLPTQGINCQGGGLKEHAEKYVEWVGAQPEFQGKQQ